MSNFIVEVVIMSGRDWVSKGFHRSGSGLTGDPFHIDGRSAALAMTEDSAKRRVELYRRAGHRARVVDVDGRVVLDFDDPVTKQQNIDRFSQHELHEYRGLRILEDRATGTFWHRFAWPVQGGSERSVSGKSCEDVIERLQEMPGDIPAYLAATLDRVEAPSAVQSTAPQPIGPPIMVPPGTLEVMISERPANPR